MTDFDDSGPLKEENIGFRVGYISKQWVDGQRNDWMYLHCQKLRSLWELW